ncbi:MAG: isoprenylcysteine carboxylmethyltransferase family protein [Desulfosarcina sp.]
MIEKLRIVISRMFVLLLAVVILVSADSWDDIVPFVSQLLFSVGLVLVTVAVVGRLWCSLYIAGYKTDTLITQGPYSVCRNPLYFFSLIGAVGVGLATETILIPVVILIAFGAYYPFVIKSEEALLLKLHESAFETYMQTVPRFFPNLNQLTEPLEYIVKPKIFRRHMFDALWFIWIAGLLELIEELHHLQVLPTLFKIY